MAGRKCSRKLVQLRETKTALKRQTENLFLITDTITSIKQVTTNYRWYQEICGTYFHGQE